MRNERAADLRIQEDVAIDLDPLGKEHNTVIARIIELATPEAQPAPDICHHQPLDSNLSLLSRSPRMDEKAQTIRASMYGP